MVDVKLKLPFAYGWQVSDHPKHAVAALNPSPWHAGAREEPFTVKPVGYMHHIGLTALIHVGYCARIPAEEGHSGVDTNRADAIRKVGEVDGQSFARHKMFARQIQVGVALAIGGVVAYRPSRLVKLVDVCLKLFDRLVEINIAQEFAVADFWALRDERHHLAVRTPGRFAVVLEVARKVVRCALSIHRHQPDVGIGELVRQLRNDPAPVRAPCIATSRCRCRTAAKPHSVGCREGEHSARIMPCEARSVRTDGKAYALSRFAGYYGLDEGRVLPPWLRWVFRFGLYHIACVALIAQIVERAPVGREGTFALVGAGSALNQRRLADDRIHYIKVASCGECDLHSVVAEGHISVGVVVPAKLVATTFYVASGHIAGFRPEVDDLWRRRGVRRVEAPEVELLAEYHDSSVGAERRLEHMIRIEEGQLCVGTCGNVVPPHVAHATLCVQIVEARPVRHPLWTAAVAFVHDHRRKLARRNLIAPYLPGGRAEGVAALAVQLVAAPCKEYIRAVGTHYGIRRLHVEQRLLCAAFVGAYGENPETCLRPGIVAIAYAEQFR